MWRVVTIALASALMGISVSTVRAESIEDAEKVLVENFSKLRSYAAKVSTKENVDLGDGKTLKSEVKGSVEWVRKDGKLLYRSDAESSATQTFNETTTPTYAKTTMISDGEFFYTVSEVMGQIRAAKQLPHPSLVADPGTMLKSLRQDHEVTLTPNDQNVGGAPCYVFEVRPKKPEDSPMARTMIYFRKDLGMTVKSVGFDTKDNIVYSTEHSEAKHNIEIDPERFVLKLPEGVQLTDMTKP